MRTTWTVVLVLLVLSVSVCGCSGVILSAKYSQALDEQAALVGHAASLAEQHGIGDANGQVKPEAAVHALKSTACMLQLWQNARDGKVK